MSKLLQKREELNAQREKKNGKTELKNKKLKILQYYKTNKRIVLVAVVVLIIAIVNIVKSIQHSIQIATEEGRNYFITTQEDIYTDCNLEESSYGYLSCKNVSLTGSYSDYNTTALKASSFDLKAGDGSFTVSTGYSLSKSEYEKDDFDINNIKGEHTTSTKINLYNNVLSREMASKTITTHFKLNEQDKSLIAKKNQDWKQWKAEEEQKKAQQEAEAAAKKAQEEAEAAAKKAQEEAEAAAKKAEEEKAQQQQAENEKYNITTDQLIKSIDACTDMLYITTGYSMVPAQKNLKSHGSAAIEYTENITFSDGTVWFSCTYNWKENTAKINLWEYK